MAKKDNLKDAKNIATSQDGIYPYKLKLFSWLIILFGIILHIRQYAFSRSLWFDEALLALSIFQKSVMQLLEPFGPPAGFLMILKFLTNVFGHSEYVLRLFPFVCGIASIILFYKVAKYYLEPKASIIALGLFVLSDRLIYFSSEVKHYSSDVAMALVLYLIAIGIQSKRITISRIIFFAMAGAVSLWISHTSIFILMGIGVAISFNFWKNRDWSSLGKLTIVALFWIISLIGVYFVSFKGLSVNPSLQGYWDKSFMPFPPRSLTDIQWIIDRFFSIFKDPAGLVFTGLAALNFFIGCASLFKKNKEGFIIFVSAIILPLIASAMHKYPFEGRVLLFCVPAVLILIAEGAYRIIYSAKENYVMVGIPLVLLLFFNPVITDIGHLIKPRVYEETKPVFNYIKKNWREGDTLYLYPGAQPAFNYYQEKYRFDRNNCIEGINSRHDYQRYVADLSRLRGKKRVWVVFSHVWKDEGEFFVYHLNNMGKAADAFGGDGAAVYLYDLSQ